MFRPWKNLFKRRICMLPFVVFAVFGGCYGTTAVFVITPQGMVAGADQLTTMVSSGGGILFKTSDIPKIELINERFIVATVGLTEINVQKSEGPVTAYSFRGWSRGVGK